MCVGLQVPIDSQVLKHSQEENSSRSWIQCYAALVPNAPSSVPKERRPFFLPGGVLLSDGGHNRTLWPSFKGTMV